MCIYTHLSTQTYSTYTSHVHLKKKVSTNRCVTIYIYIFIYVRKSIYAYVCT